MVDEVKELAQAAKNTAKEKFDELKNMSSQERLELAKEKANQAKDIGNKAKDTAKEVFSELKDKPFPVIIENIKIFFLQMPFKLKVIILSVAAAAVVLPILISSPSYSPKDLAEYSCEAFKDGDFKEYSTYMHPDAQKQGLGMMLDRFDNPRSRELRKTYDCSNCTFTPTGIRTMKIVHCGNVPSFSIQMFDGQWYSKTPY